MAQTPEVIREVKPRYSEEAMRAGIEGTVEVEVTIEKDGSVKDARVIRSIPMLDEAALEAARQWRFKAFQGDAITRTIELSFMLRPSLSSDGAVRVGGNIKTPTKIHHVSPVYPPDAHAARVTGVVILETRIGADGSVEEARVLRSIPLLDQAAIDAVMQWRFVPTLLNGQAVPVIMTVTVNFTLEGEPYR